jgi:hypothetical protein
VTTSKVIKRLVQLAPDVFRAYPLRTNRCIYSTAAGIAALGQLGVEARPLSVVYDIVNQSWVQWTTDGHPGGPAEAMRRGCKIVSCGYPPGAVGSPVHLTDPGTGWHGHLVIEVPDLQLLIDLNFEQFSRPAHQLVLPGAVVLNTQGRDVMAFDVPVGGLLRVEAKRADHSYEDAKDWQLRAARTDIVHSLVQAVRKGTVL